MFVTPFLDLQDPLAAMEAYHFPPAEKARSGAPANGFLAALKGRFRRRFVRCSKNRRPSLPSVFDLGYEGILNEDERSVEEKRDGVL
jgi:hypothetical protein